MPARFVEVTTPLHLAEAARNADALSFLPSFADLATWTASNGSAAGLTDWTLDIPLAPQGHARTLFLAACALFVVRVALLHSATRRALTRHGTAREA